MVWFDWVLLAFKQERGDVKNLDYEEEMEKLNKLKNQQINEKQYHYPENS